MPVWVDNVYRMTRNSGAGYLYEHKAGNLTKNGCVCTNIATLPYTTHNAYNFRFFMRFRNFGGGHFFLKIDFPLCRIVRCCGGWSP